MTRCLAQWFVTDAPPAICESVPTVCSECIRALAFQWWDAITRHPGPEPRCVLCEIGHAAYCGIHAMAAVHEHRARLVADKHGLGMARP